MSVFFEGNRVMYTGSTWPYGLTGTVIEARGMDAYRVKLDEPYKKFEELTTLANNMVLVTKPKPEVTPRGKILREAEKLITGDRNKNYGSPTENFDTTAALWNAQLGHKLKPGESFTATDVALLMIQLKMARLKTSTSNRDHYLDIAGYVACGWECQEVEDASA